MLKLDHLALMTTNVYRTCADILQTTGLNSYEGGHFAGFGVMHRGIPLGNTQYIEVESVFDADEALVCEYSNGRFAMLNRELLPYFQAWWCLTDDIQQYTPRFREFDLAERHAVYRRRVPNAGALPITTRQAPGTMEAAPYGMPAFWWLEPATMPNHPANRKVGHRVEPRGIAWLELGGDRDAVATWIGTEIDQLPLRFVGGPPGVRAVGVSLADGTVAVIRPDERGRLSTYVQSE